MEQVRWLINIIKFDSFKMGNGITHLIRNQYIFFLYSGWNF